VALAVKPSGEPGFVLLGHDGAPRLRFAIGEGDRPSVSLVDRKGATRAALTLEGDGQAALYLYGENGEVRSYLR